MARPRFNHKPVIAVFERLIRSKASLEWKEIVAAVEAEAIVVANWLNVRGVLQYYVSHGILVRDTTNLRVERYEVRPA